jgi:hypothetical protein
MGDADLSGLDGLDPELDPAFRYHILWTLEPVQAISRSVAVFPPWRVADIRFPLRF